MLNQTIYICITRSLIIAFEAALDSESSIKYHNSKLGFKILHCAYTSKKLLHLKQIYFILITV